MDFKAKEFNETDFQVTKQFRLILARVDTAIHHMALPEEGMPVWALDFMRAQILISLASTLMQSAHNSCTPFEKEGMLANRDKWIKYYFNQGDAK